MEVLWWLRDQTWLDLKVLWNIRIIHTLLEIIALLPKANSYASLSRPPVPDIALNFRFVLPSPIKNLMDLDPIPLQSHSPDKPYSAWMQRQMIFQNITSSVIIHTISNEIVVPKIIIQKHQTLTPLCIPLSLETTFKTKSMAREKRALYYTRNNLSWRYNNYKCICISK